MLSKRFHDEYLKRKFDSWNYLKKLSVDELLSLLKKDFGIKSSFFKTEQWHCQLACIYAGIKNPDFLFLLDPGGGKTSAALNVIKYRLEKKQIKHALVVAPKLLNITSWEEDIVKHSDLTFTPVFEGTQANKYKTLLNPTTDITVIDYAGFRLALSKDGSKKQIVDKNKINELQGVYEMAVLDEIHFCKTDSTILFNTFEQFFLDIKYKIGMTGTLFDNHALDVFSSYYLIDGGETFGNSLEVFREVFLLKRSGAIYHSKRDYEFNEDRSRIFNRMLQSKALRFEESEFTHKPEHHHKKVRFYLSEEQEEHYKNALNGMINAKGDLKENDAGFIRYRQIISGYLVFKDVFGTHHYAFKNNAKMNALFDLLKKHQDEKVLIFYDYTFTAELIIKELEKAGITYQWLYGKTKRTEKKSAVNDFIKSGSRVFIANSESASTGVDGLQKVISVLIFYETPLRLATRKQAVRRIDRFGKTRESVSYDLVAMDTLDTKILRRIAEQSKMFDVLIDKA